MRRPYGISALAVLFFCGGACALALSCFGLFGIIYALTSVIGAGFAAIAATAFQTALASAGLLAFVGFGGALVTVAVGLWQLRQWARLATVVLAAICVTPLGTAIAFVPMTLLYPQLNWSHYWVLSFLFSGLVVLYMFSPKAKQAFSSSAVAGNSTAIPEPDPRLH